MPFGPAYTEDGLQKLKDRVTALENEVKRLKNKYHDANIPELHHRTGMDDGGQFPYG